MREQYKRIMTLRECMEAEDGESRPSTALGYLSRALSAAFKKAFRVVWAFLIFCTFALLAYGVMILPGILGVNRANHSLAGILAALILIIGFFVSMSFYRGERLF